MKFKKMENIYLPKQHKISQSWEENETIKTFRIEHSLKHEPGQFLMASVFNFGEAPISISSYSEKFVDLTIRRVGRVTNALHRLKEGDFLGLRGPYGKGYPLKKLKGKDLLIIGGGCGVAPLRSIIHYAEKFRDKYGEIELFLGYKNPSEVLFKRELERWMKKFNVHLTIDKPDEEWEHEVGVVTKPLEKAKIRPRGAVALTCGPPIMIKFVIKTLKEKRFRNEQIYISLERRMKCGVGKCGHCMINDKYVCLDGPVFNYAEGKFLED